jgi:hypothetical protein
MEHGVKISKFEIIVFVVCPFTSDFYLLQQMTAKRSDLVTAQPIDGKRLLLAESYAIFPVALSGSHQDPGR